eukprot:1147943-Pelagomonas_calceolata.AAC.4
MLHRMEAAMPGRPDHACLLFVTGGVCMHSCEGACMLSCEGACMHSYGGACMHSCKSACFLS